MVADFEAVGVNPFVSRSGFAQRGNYGHRSIADSPGFMENTSSLGDEVLTFHKVAQDRTGPDWSIVKAAIRLRGLDMVRLVCAVLPYRKGVGSHGRDNPIGRIFLVRNRLGKPAAPQHFTFKEKLRVGPDIFGPSKGNSWVARFG